MKGNINPLTAAVVIIIALVVFLHMGIPILLNYLGPGMPALLRDSLMILRSMWVSFLKLFGVMI